MFILILPGLTWGTYRCLNLDQVAFLNVTSSKRPYLHPVHFDKPLFSTYVNHFVVVTPVKNLQKVFVFSGFDKGKVEQTSAKVTLILARLLQYGFYAILVILVFQISSKFFSPVAGAASAILLGTCAGILPYVVFLTADVPLITWTVACFACCCAIIKTPSLKYSLLAGACAGIAFATKYNGLLIAPLIPLAHFLSPTSQPIRSTLRRPAFYAGCFAVPVAFVLANPYSLLDWKGFYHGFLYTYTVTPVYDGQTGSSYWAFLKAYPEIFGPILSWMLLPLFVLSIGLIVSEKLTPLANRVWLLALAFFCLYFWKVGSFPRLETRFVLPTIFVVLLLIAPAWSIVWKIRRLFLLLITVTAIYGFASGIFVGQNFRQDPRQEAVRWAEKNFPEKVIIEYSGGSPDWRHMATRNITSLRMPEGLDRKERFTKIFGNDPAMQEVLKRNLQPKNTDWFSPESREKRGATFVAFSSVDMTDSNLSDYYEAFLSGSYGFEKVFEGTSPNLPGWVYPQRTEFIRNHFTIFQKRN
ncbi:MAG: glycosyltransferase family 39 protein [Chthoniobacterales bacterium]